MVACTATGPPRGYSLTRPEGRGHRIVKVQPTQLSGAHARSAGAPTLQLSRRPVRRLRHGGMNGGAEIELAVAVSVGAGEFKERARRGVQRVRLHGRGSRAGASKQQFQRQLLYRGEYLAQSQRRNVAPPQALAPYLTPRSRGN